MSQLLSTKAIFISFLSITTLVTSPLFCMFGYENISENDMNACNIRVNEPLKKKLKLELNGENEQENYQEDEQQDRAQKFENALIAIRSFNFQVLEQTDQDLENLYHEIIELGLLELSCEEPYIHFVQDQSDRLMIDWIMEQSSQVDCKTQQTLKTSFLSALQFLEKTIQCFEFKKVDPEVTFEDGSKRVMLDGGKKIVQGICNSIVEMIKKYQ